MSYIIASNSEMSQAMAEGKRDVLAERTVPLFENLEKLYSVSQFQFHLPPAISFLRAHKVNKFGDDLSSFRKTILATNNNQQPVQGLEKGIAGLGIRGISPVYYQSSHIGSVEFGMSFGQKFFTQFKEKYNVDITLHVKRDAGFETFGTTLYSKGKQSVVLLNTEQLDKAFNGKDVVEQKGINDIPYAVYAKRVTDFSGNAIGVMEIAFDRSHYVASISSTRNSTLFIGILALIIGMIIATLIAKTIVNPITTAVDAMNEIAQGDGDLTKRLDDNGNNEIALLGSSFNLFAEKVRKMVLQVSGSTLQLAAAAEEMSMITHATNDGVKKQQTETEMVATAMNEMTTTVQEVARHATEASNSAQSADKEAASGKIVVEKTVVAINSLAAEIETSSDLIQELESNSSNIGTVLVVIRSIAEQTNLLALNAAIEAARAGEQGRGFAVVADEVRTLASRTQDSTQEIQGMIESLQQGSKNVVNAMEASKVKSKKSVEQAVEALRSLDEITNSVTTISDMNIQIAGAADEQRSVSEEINKNIINISAVVEESAEGAQQTLIASQDLAKLASELQKLVEQFKT
jgi:methyl-accepting chemotaxis protein